MSIVGSNRGQRAGKGTNLAGTDSSSPAGSGQLRLDEEEISITLRRAWDRALRMLSQRVNKPTFETHLRSLRPLTLSQEPNERGRVVHTVTLGAPSAFTREWVEKRHSPLITQTLEEIFDTPVVVRLVLSPKEKEADPSAAETAVEPEEDNGLLDTGVAGTKVFTGGPRGAAAPETARNGARRAMSSVATEAPAAARPEARTPAASTPAPARSNRTASVTVAADSPADAAPRKEAPSAEPARRTPAAYSASSPTTTARSEDRSMPFPDAPTINPRYTFDRFVVGTANRLAHGGAMAVAESPGDRYNPLFLYGSPGLGKTHLMHAIGNAYIQARGEGAARRVAYMSGEMFTTQFISSLRQHKTEEFRRKSRNVDLWLVDDVQFIAGKESTKEEFFHTFNVLYQAGKQIVICSDRSPRDLRTMDERLQSRFESGLVADIVAPDLETRLAILQKKAEQERTRIPDDVLLYMARLVQSNIRTLEGALVKLVAYASLVNSPVTTQMAASILERYFVSAGIGQDAAMLADETGDDESAVPTAPASATKIAGANAHLTPSMVQGAVATRLGLSLDVMTGKRRDRDAVNARQLAMHLLRELTDMSLPGIGQIFGGRDHSTVIHACDRIKSQIPSDPDLRSLIEELTIQMRSKEFGSGVPSVSTDQLAA